jgi:hypothetical protein
VCEKPPPLAVYDYFGFRTAFKIKVPRRMHVVAAKGRNHNEIGFILEIKHRCCSLAPGFPAPRSEQHKGRSSERIA